MLYGMYVGALASARIGNLVIRIGTEGGWLPQGARNLLAGASVLPLIVAAFLFWRLLRSELDEMLQRIVLEGMAIALVVFVLRRDWENVFLTAIVIVLMRFRLRNTSDGP